MLLLWTLLTPSHFQKGGVDTKFYFAVAMFVAAVSVLINFLFDNFHWIEKTLVSLPIAFISLFVMTIIVGPQIVELFYGDKTWFLWETKHRILINAAFYGLNTVMLAILSFIYFKIRTLMKNRRKWKGAIA